MDESDVQSSLGAPDGSVQLSPCEETTCCDDQDDADHGKGEDDVPVVKPHVPFLEVPGVDSKCQGDCCYEEP